MNLTRDELYETAFTPKMQAYQLFLCAATVAACISGSVTACYKLYEIKFMVIEVLAYI